MAKGKIIAYIEMDEGSKAIGINVYNDTYSIVDGWINRDGEFNMDWCEVTFGRKGEEQTLTLPKGIGRFSRLKDLSLSISQLVDEAVRNLKDASTPLPDDDIPF